MIVKNLKDMNAIFGILEKVGSEVNSYYWRDDAHVDIERASELRDLQDHLIKRGYIDSSYDLAKLTYSFLDMYPQSETAIENNRQYQEVLNKLDEYDRRVLISDMQCMEKDMGEKLDMSVKFNMALEKLLDSTSDES